ncbi:uncharacterized protein OCT59_021159 [Rhizophagus irregularis]|uniref:uncharacterized protein n=1 Tax=Rhizophagus irregularis TaxID=588596 RepID=UPI00332C28E1|nr:hypothetical protein OCT59_021159 [Rhizophagus irregularis]
MDQFIFKNKLKWIPYDKFENIEYFDKGEFGTIYKAKYDIIEVILKYFDYLNNSDEGLNELLNERKIINSNEIIEIYGFTKDPDTLDYVLVMEYTNKGSLKRCLTEITKNWKQKLFCLYQIIKGLNYIHEKDLIHYNFHNDLMTKCWDEDPLKRPSSKEVLKIIKNWIFRPENKKIKDIINEELINNIMEFINAPIEHNNLIVKSHPKAYSTSHLFDFTSKELNEILEGTQGFFESKQNYQSSYNIQMELVNLQQNSTLQNEEFAKKENTLQIQIKNLQSEKQALDGKLTEQLKQNSQLNQEKNNLQDKLVQTEAIIQELKSQQDQFKNQLIQIEEENFKLENELVDLQQKNFKFEQNNQNLRLNLAIQIKKFAEKENVLQTQIIDLQNEMQFLIDNLTKQLEQNKQTNQQIQVQVSQLKQEKFDLQEKLIQTEVNIQELKSQQESLTEQKEQLENKLSQSQVNCEQIEQEKIRLHNMVKGLSQEQKLTTKLKTKLEKEIAQLEQKLIIEEQIKMQLTQALQIKDDKINELEKKLVTLDQERIKQLKDKVKELNKIEKELLNKLTSGENTKEIHKEKEAKQKEMNELQQELSRTSDSYDANRKKLIISQVNNFLKVKGDFLTLREEAIKKLQNCCNHLESSINKERNTISSIRDLKTSKLTDKYTKEFQSILVKYNDGLLELNKDYYFLKNVVQENKELEVSLMIENILKLNFFNLDKYKIFKFATNSQEGTRIQLNSNMMEEDINSLRKNLNELKLELNQEKNELKNLATV